jgi:HAD superfamily hydrolase (TIGR01549 family)
MGFGIPASALSKRAWHADEIRSMSIVVEHVMQASGNKGAVLFDLDGTLVDSNYQHTTAWYLAFREQGIVLPIWRIHRHIGMGGDQIVPALAGAAVDASLGDALRASEASYFEQIIDQVEPLAGAHELLEELDARGYELVLASSSPHEYLDRYLALLQADSLIDAATTSADVESTKPAPDLIEVASGRARSRPLVMVGDSPWDIAAAARARLSCVALLTGGYSERELLEAGATSVFSSLDEMRSEIGRAWLV